MFKKLLILSLFFVFSANIFAKDGSSGCGPGWYVSQKNSLLSSSIRGTTNSILVPTVTFGMTFGTSGCAKHSIVKADKERIKFATDNYFEIASQATRGDGDFLVAYGELYGCNTKSLKHFSKTMKGNFGELFPSTEIAPSKLVNKTYHMILADKTLIHNCLQG